MLFRIFLLCAMFQVAVEHQGQVLLDTVVLSRAECGMWYKVYRWELFYGSGPASYGYRPRTAQDRWFCEAGAGRWFLVFTDRNGRKMFEGAVDGGQMHGPVTFYRMNGSMERREFRGFEQDLVAWPEIEWSDVEHEVGTWSWYDRKGRLRKEERFMTLSHMHHDHPVHYRLRITVRFVGKARRTREHVKVLDSTE